MTDQIIKIKLPTKTELCLVEFIHRSSEGLIQLEAFNAYGESCLHTSVSTLCNTKGIKFARETQPHINRMGGKTYFTRYWLLDDQEIAKAKALVIQCQIKRGLLSVGGSYEKTNTNPK